ncbi:MAG TPA: alanine--glyoxylate aminotransferase family protein [Elusimicrobiota bacterium]|jgi:aspartate aminotransferase-like enzyme|nr:alanine--glyoxylate aminotransferase family protein [Elusimicrobiota bacterium]
MPNKNIMLTPGPTPLPPQVLEAMSRPLIHHRTEEFGKLFVQVIEDMKWVYRTKHTVLMMTCSGTGAMESAVTNLLSPGDSTLVCTTGAFGDRFVAIHKAFGLSPVVLPFEWGRAVEPEALRASLKAHKGLKAVFFQHTDTSTGVVNDLKTLAKIVREESDALVVADSVSGLACEPLETDAWGLDAVVTGSQKGLMNAPGLGFVALSERAWKAVEAARLPRYNFDYRIMKKSLADRETPWTPAISVVAGQAAALKLLRAEGMENVWKRHDELAAHARRELSAKLGLPFYAKDPANILTGVLLPPGVDGVKLLADILREEGISIAGGQLQLKGKLVRLAHMGYISKADVDAGVEALARRLAKVRA